MLTKTFITEFTESTPPVEGQSASHSCPEVPPDGSEGAPPDSGGPPAPEGCHWGIVCPDGSGGDGNESGSCVVGLICD